jgi:ectoine hydroxylase-related dioxygenase (phytanoyl-CoA dioxygenase family)
LRKKSAGIFMLFAAWGQGLFLKRRGQDRMDPIAQLLPGVPLVESPLFPTLVDRVGWSDKEREIARQLHERGYAVLDFPDDQLEQRIARIKAALAPRFGLPAHGDADPQVVSELADARVQDAWKFDEDVKALAINAQVLDLLSRLWGRQAHAFQTLNFPVGTQQHLHSDSVHFSSQPERFMCGVWVALEHLHPDSGILEYLPGSHRWPILSNAMVGRRAEANRALPSAQTPYEPVWRAMVEQSGIAKETFLARKGQALIWAANLLHGGGPRSDRSHTRWSQVTHYYFDDCLYYTPAFSEEVLGKLELRQLRDIATGEALQNSYMGEAVARPAPMSGTKSKGLWKKIKAARKRLAKAS